MLNVLIANKIEKLMSFFSADPCMYAWAATNPDFDIWNCFDFKISFWEKTRLPIACVGHGFVWMCKGTFTKFKEYLWCVISQKWMKKLLIEKYYEFDILIFIDQNCIKKTNNFWIVAHGCLQLFKLVSFTLSKCS